MIVYNGASGGLGRYLASRAAVSGVPTRAISARLEDRLGTARELDAIETEAATFIHLAARVSVSECEADPTGAHRINVDGALAAVNAVAEWARGRHVSLRVIYVSTGHVYRAPAHGTRVTEGAAVGPRSVYATTKLLAEDRLTEDMKVQGVPFLVARVFGVVAPKQAASYVLPSILARLRRADSSPIPGLENVRDYLDARDICGSLIRLASVHWMRPRETVNVCSGRPTTVRELYETAARTMYDPPFAAELIASVKAAPGRHDDVPWLVGDPSAFTRLTRAPAQQIPLEATIEEALGHVA